MNGCRELDHLADLAGIEPFYWDIWGNGHEVSPETKRAILTSLGFAVQQHAAVEASVTALEAEPWRRSLPPVLVLREAEVAEVPLVLPAAEVDRETEWTLIEEGGSCRKGRFRPADAPQIGARQLEGIQLERRAIELPLAVPPGYHTLELALADAAATLKLIVTPPRCYLPRQLSEGGRRWGIAAQLYALRSPQNWGIGDLSDLADLLEVAGKLGASTLAINPLHALFSADPERVSPYTPSSRLQLNSLYLDVVAIPDFAECESARDLVGSDAFGARLAAVRACELVDYPEVAALKGKVLKRLYASFLRTHLVRRTERAAAFRRFQSEGGERLRHFAVFQVLMEFFRYRPWQTWPASYRDSASEEVAMFSWHCADRVGFFQYLQWQADLQLQAAQRRAGLHGMSLGIYRDLAVGIDPDGADAWAEQEVAAQGIRIGAPADPFSPKGQDWGLLPLQPQKLRETAYEHFIATLRANMRAAGALRIDHVMGLRRMFWIPAGAEPVSGAYVRYPCEDLLGILALESQRNRCVVIGEDLGTVPEGFRERMAESGALSYRVFYFEKKGDRFSSPAEYPELALACASTHDLPTLKGFWERRDLALRKQFGLYPGEEARDEEERNRQHDRLLLLRALAAENLLPPSVKPEDPEQTLMTPEIAEAVHLYLARSPACLLVVQIEDLLGEVEQTNLPGTVRERPNWQRRLSLELGEFAANPSVRSLAEALRPIRADH
jgi:4-alpha-glucanotransferase